MSNRGKKRRSSVARNRAHTERVADDGRGWRDGGKVRGVPAAHRRRLRWRLTLGYSLGPNKRAHQDRRGVGGPPWRC